MSGLLITDVAVFDSRSGDFVDGPVWIRDGVIEAVGADATGAAGAPDGADERLSGDGGTLIPGLIDCHCHAYGISLDGAWTESRELSYVALMAARRLGAALRRGFTTVRDVAGGDPGLAAAIAQGLLSAPRYLYTGPALSQTGGHGDPRSVDEASCGCGAAHSVGGIGCEVVDGVDALRAAVRDRFRRGAHAIKIMASGGVMSLTDPIRFAQYSPEEIRAVADEAQRRGSYVCAHAYSPEAISHAVRNGVRSIEHGNLLDSPTAELMADRGAVLIPTLATYDAMGRLGVEIGMNAVSLAKNAEVLEHGRRAIELARAAGVTVGFGTDLMGELEREQLNGLRLQAEVEGIARTLQAATLVNAGIIGRDDLGVVEPGAVADLVILPGDVLAHPEVLWGETRTVIQAGVVVH